MNDRVWSIGIGCVLAATGAAPAGPAVGTGGIELIGSFNPAEGGAMNSIGFNTQTDEVFVHFNGSAVYHVYATDGTFLRTIPKPDPGGNDDDMDFAAVPVNVNGTIVPAHSLLVIENDSDPPRIFAVDPSDGAVLAEQAFNGSLFGTWTGGGYALASGTFFTSDWSRDFVQEVDASNGTVLREFSIRPAGSPSWGFFYSDLEVLDADGNLYLVSDSQTSIRGMTPAGAWLGDFEIGPLGVSGMSGIALDDETGEAWISSQNGTVYRLSGFPPDGCVIADLAFPLGVLDLNDVTGFVNAFLSQQPVADLAEPFTVFDLADVVAFIDAFLAGCP
jgi:outer membrane protein assembly factor BamB